jgi:hypothetical protein
MPAQQPTPSPFFRYARRSGFLEACRSASLVACRSASRSALRYAVWLAALLSFAVPVRAQWQTDRFGDGDMAADLAEALTFQKYPTYPQYLEMMQQFQREYPGICRLDTFGTSVEGRLLLALEISDHAGTDEPEARFLYTSTIHGDEPLGMVLLLRLARTLLEGYGNDNELTGLVDGLSIWINPLFNPDGTYSADQGLSMLHAQRDNVHGIDLNRNFPEPGLHTVTDTSGRQKETIAMMRFLAQQPFTLSANLHTGDEVVNYPWDHTYTRHADDDWYRLVSREYADEARAVDPGYMALFPDGITNGADWYRIHGGRQDYVNYFLEGREVTLELSNEKMPEAGLLEGFWEKNQRSLINYMAQCMYGIRGTVTDAADGTPVRARIFLPDHDSAYSVVHSTDRYGDFYRLVREGTYELIASAPGYLNDTLRGVEVTDFNATLVQIALQADPKAGTIETGQAPQLSIYPNPAEGLVTIHPLGLEPGEMEIRILRPDGTIMRQSTLPYSGDPVTLQLGPLPAGYYILSITSGTLHLSRTLIHLE